MLPDLDGFEVCWRIRARSDVPVLMLTARGEDTDRIVGLEIGADDYLSKPFDPRVLLARIRVILRRRRGAGPDAALCFGRLQIDRGSRTIRVDGSDRPLSSYQFDLLAALAENAGRVLSRERLLDLVKGAELEAFDRSIDVHVSRIRSAIEDDPKHPRRIITVRGSGYVFAKTDGDGTDVSFYDRDGMLIASHGRPVPLAQDGAAGWEWRRTLRVDLPGGRIVLYRWRPPVGAGWRTLTVMLIVARGVGLAAFPVTVRFTRRLEGLRSGMAHWGDGELSTRVDEAGSDEVALVARTFNAAAGRVDTLLASQRALLGSQQRLLQS